MLEEDLLARGPAAGSDTPALLRWPPPGLESLQGAAWPLITALAAGACIAVIPLLLSVVTPQSFFSTGLFGASWWFPVLAALLGVLLVLFAVWRVVRLLLAGARAVRRGHDWATVAYVMSDSRHDAGFLMQGARQYAPLPERERRWLLTARVIATAAYAAALLWVPFGFCAGVVLSGRGYLEHATSLTTIALLPAAAIMMVALGCRLLESFSTQQLGRQWRRTHNGESGLREEIGAWRSIRDERLEQPPARTARTRPVLVVAAVLALTALLLPLPLITIAVATAVGPVVARFSVPRLDATAARIAKAAMLAPYALEPDPSVSATEAGELLHALALVNGRASAQRALERQPVRRFVSWPRDAAPASLPAPERYAELFARAGSLSRDELAFLERAGNHAAQAEFARVARARVADMAAGRWNTDLLATASVFELPIAGFGGLRSASHFHIARAVLQSARGERAAAETTLREVISVGLLIAREGPTMIDVLVGNSMAITGGAALEQFYRSSGRTADAEALRLATAGIDQMEQVTRALRTTSDVDDALRRAMAMTANEQLPRGMRWESLITLQIGAGCLNPNSAVFGRGAAYEAWLANARHSLVRYPSEDALFEMVRRGPALPAGMRGRAGVVEKMLSVTLGRDDVAGRCASLLTGITNN